MCFDKSFNFWKHRRISSFATGLYLENTGLEEQTIRKSNCQVKSLAIKERLFDFQSGRIFSMLLDKSWYFLSFSCQIYDKVRNIVNVEIKKTKSEREIHVFFIEKNEEAKKHYLSYYIIYRKSCQQFLCIR